MYMELICTWNIYDICTVLYTYIFSPKRPNAISQSVNLHWGFVFVVSTPFLFMFSQIVQLF